MARGFSGTTGGYPANEYNLKRTTESTESENSQIHYMRHTSSSIERAKNRTFGRSPQGPQEMQLVQVGGNVSASAQTWAQLRNYKNSVTSNSS